MSASCCVCLDEKLCIWQCGVCRDGLLCRDCLEPLETGEYWPHAVKCPICRTDKTQTTAELQAALNAMLKEWNDTHPESESDDDEIEPPPF